MPDLPPDALLRRRQNALLAKWASGKRLPADELAEIADLLPKPQAPLQLEAQVEGASPSGYREGPAAYAARFGQSVRTIQRWIAQKAPLDDLGAIPDWWAKAHNNRKMPNKLADALAALSPGAPPAMSIPSTANEPAKMDAPPPLELTSTSRLDQDRILLNNAYVELIAAQRAGVIDRISRAQRAHTAASEQLRRSELADPKIRAASGAVVDREKVRSALGRLHTSVAASWRSFCKRMRRELIGKEPAEQEVIWQRETDKVFARFREFEFADPVA